MKQKFLSTFFLFLLAAGVLLIHCSTNLVDESHFCRGIVTDSATGVPIDSAWIDVVDTLPPYPFYSDSAGHYRAQFFGKQWINIYCGKEGYFIGRKRLYNDREYDNIDFKLVHQ